MKKIPWPDDADHEARVGSTGLVYFRLRGTETWRHQDAHDSAVTRRVYSFDGE